jgi:hypothetical protein
MNNAKFIKNIACPKCRENGKDKSGDNLATYNDGSSYCWNCGHYTLSDNVISQFLSKGINTSIDTPPLITTPFDCCLDYPDKSIHWFNNYSLTKSDMLNNGMLWSESEQRLIIPLWNGGELLGWQGRYFGVDKDNKKWFGKGNLQEIYHILFNGRVGQAYNDANQLVLTEDIISAIKVSKLGIAAMPLFGVNIKTRWKLLRILKYQEVIIFLDPDMHTKSLLQSKEGALQGVRNRCILSTKDPKEYSYDELKEILK